MEGGLKKTPNRTGDGNRLWGYAATFGATWAALEVTVGSFAHALKLPFAGVVLASLGAALLIALRNVYPRPGVVLAAGIVCAGVKLLSPAGAVFGPMLAILIEAALAELLLLPFGARRWIAPLIGVVVCWYAVTQKLLTQWLLYGSPILGIYLGILQRAEAWTGLPQQGGLSVALLFMTLVGLIGATLASLGQRVGSRAVLYMGEGPR